jgi:probable rRNA maturation factor
MDQKLVLPLLRQMFNFSYEFHGVDIEGFVPSDFTIWLKKVMKHYNVKSAFLMYVFVSDEYLLDMNRSHLNHDYYTDIITFNMNEGNSLCGEMYISVDRVRENAAVFANGNFMLELSRVMVHGVLHLLGYDDRSESDEVVIRKQEELCLMLK